jgi:hypothetical protein
MMGCPPPTMAEAAVVTLVPGLAPAAPIMRVLAQFNRRQIETFAEVAIALLDLADGDPDLEVTDAEDDFATVTGDGPGCKLGDPGGQCTEDEISAFRPEDFAHHGPGCPISDPAGHDEGDQ